MNRSCPICFGAEKLFLYKQNFHNNVISLMANYDVVICKKCGFAYADNIPAQADFDDYYAAMSKYEFNYKEGIVSNDYLEHFAKIFNFLVPHIKGRNAKILDIGCSTGGLLSIFKANGYSHLMGIDPSPACAKAAKELYDIEARINNIADFHTKKKFDLIILSAVLEHLVDFENSMRKISSLLKEQGSLFIEVPDSARFALYIAAPFQQFSIEHINYFSPCSMKNLLSAFSFKIKQILPNENRTNPNTDPDIFVLAEKARGNDSQISKDAVSELNIKNYIARCSEIDMEIKKIIRTKLANKNKIIVWGVGTHTQRLIGSGLDLAKILYFVDSNARYVGKKLQGIEIKAPGAIQEKIPILISTYSYQQEIAQQIKKTLKLNNEVITIY